MRDAKSSSSLCCRMQTVCLSGSKDVLHSALCTFHGGDRGHEDCMLESTDRPVWCIAMHELTSFGSARRLPLASRVGDKEGAGMCPHNALHAESSADGRSESQLYSSRSRSRRRQHSRPHTVAVSQHRCSIQDCTGLHNLPDRPPRCTEPGED